MPNLGWAPGDIRFYELRGCNFQPCLIIDPVSLSNGNQLRPPMPSTYLESFIARWSAGDGGQERANYAL
jgi:hypothetical protein